MPCEYCHTYPHRFGCPAAPEPKAVHICKACKEPIAAGEEFCILGENFYHADCVDELMVWDILELLGVEKETAEG